MIRNHRSLKVAVGLLLVPNPKVSSPGLIEVTVGG
jgi:hypothetical protein